MKANAPEEIYLLPEVGNPDGLSICWYDAPYRTGAIKYIRTDVFIERARKWFKSHGSFTIGFDGATVRDFLNFINK